MHIEERFSVNNDCYKANERRQDSRYTRFQDNGPKGLMLHSVGCPQSSAAVFARLWNKPNLQVAVHAVLQADGLVYQCLPWEYRGWHGASGPNGSVNNTHIGVEMTEPDCLHYTHGFHFTCSNMAKAREQVRGTYKTAVELFAYLCKKYKLNPLQKGIIISHNEGGIAGVASKHADPEHLWNGLDLPFTMNGFRQDVYKKIHEEDDDMTQADFNKMADAYFAAKRDLAPDSWSEKDRKWAEVNKIILGDERGRMAYKSYCTREEMVAFLHRLEQLVEKN